ncbi:hypothetical protein SK224_00245 [Microbacterium sp. BG28]|uniref:hypothetical protein n=1 Tax=Microbacterium sp. BG28 TaxID=3097356 RepID=UPI002A5AB941|nr:hypothetical protein [Microbacterium sp. BG28]MDY0827549.1 hypothetical protein [Microbacterium sp. BG28]
MGIFGRNIAKAYGPSSAPIAISSPYSPQDQLVTFAINDELGGLLKDTALMTRDIALRVPGVKRAHGVHVTQFAEIPFFQMDNAARTAHQPRWLTTSDTSEAPYQRMFGLGSDLFFNGWGCLGFTADMSDCMRIPFGMWSLNDEGVAVADERFIPAAYRARVVSFQAGAGENGLLNDGADTLREARSIEEAYMDRLANPVPLTVLGIPRDVWESWTVDERKSYRQQWIDGRQSKNGAVATKVSEWPVEMPGAAPVDLYETGRNAVRLDIANHTSTPAALLEGSKQGGSGTEMNYNGVENGATRSDLWDFGLAKRWMLAFEARMSLDDVSPPGLSIRGDRSFAVATPTPPTNPTSED